MRKFRDNEKREWAVALNVAQVKRVRDELQVDLANLDEGLIVRLAEDPVTLCDVLYVLCRDQADAAGITDEQFGRAMAGDVIDHATTALLGELVDFSRSPRRRALYRKALAKVEALETEACEIVAARLDSGELEAEMRAAIRGGSSTSSPASPA